MISDDTIAEIRAALAANRDVVLTAPPGSGKTTRVPPALLGELWLGGRKIVMLEPRRLAARNCAAYIAGVLGEAVGGTVGYQVRLERKVSSKTKLEIVTEGLLVQRLLHDPELADAGLVIFDEFHERSLACDMSFALALEVRRALRPDLRLLVMSATLDADEVAARLGNAAVIRAEGRMFPVETVYLGNVSVGVAVSRALKETNGDVLCFLPGEGEIRRCMEMAVCNPSFGGVEFLPLYGNLPKNEQDRVFERGGRKVIFSTSIAETSVTIEGVTAVVDSGLMRVPRFSPGTGMTGLVTLPLSLDRAEQRQGRAGRVRAGICYRLWKEEENQSRPKKMMPEILDSDLSSLVLTCSAWGALEREDLPWITTPPASAWDQAVGILKTLGALDGDGRLTGKGEMMSKMPMHPRLANMMAGAESTDRSSLLAAIVEEGCRGRETDIRKIADEVLETPGKSSSCRIIRLARRFAANWRDGCRRDKTAACESDGALLALAYPERVAKNRGNGTFRMVSGRGAFMDQSDSLAKEPYIVCCELDDRAGDARVFLGCPIDESEIVEIFGADIEEKPFCAWDRKNERVKSVICRSLGSMTIKETPVTAANDLQGVGVDWSEQIVVAMLNGVRQKGVANLPCWTKEAVRLRDRVNFLARVIGEAENWPAADDAAVMKALPGFIDGMSKWKDLEKLDVFGMIDFMLAESGHNRRELDSLAPSKMTMPSGSNMFIDYSGDEPTVNVRLQECFGLMETPKVAGGRVPIVMTLLSPAYRPIQITKDLAGFWRGGYQIVRKDMRGRYPKHYWPEDPLSAVATRRTVLV